MTTPANSQPTPPNPKRGSPTGVRSAQLHKGSVAVRERQLLALDMRKGGATYAQIGSDLGISDRMASRLVRRALRHREQESIGELIALDNERIDLVWSAAFPKAMSGSAPHAMVCLRALERRARLLGLDAPTKAEVRMTVEETEALDAEIEALLATYGIAAAGAPEDDDDGGCCPTPDRSSPGRKGETRWGGRTATPPGSPAAS